MGKNDTEESAQDRARREGLLFPIVTMETILGGKDTLLIETLTRLPEDIQEKITAVNTLVRLEHAQANNNQLTHSLYEANQEVIKLGELAGHLSGERLKDSNKIARLERLIKKYEPKKGKK